MAIPKIYFQQKTNEKDGQLYLYYSFFGKRLKYYTGFRIEQKFFNKDYFKSNTKKPVKNSYLYSDQVNDVLADMASFCVNEVTKNRIYGTDELKKLLDTEFKDKIELHPEEFISHDLISYAELVVSERRSGLRLIIKGNRQGQKYKADSLKNIETTIFQLKKFAKKQHIEKLPFDTIDNSFYASFRKFCIEEQSMRLSTFATRIRDIKMVMNEANEYGVTDCKGHLSTRFIKPDYEADTISISPSDIEKIHAHVFQERYNRVKDLFLIGCYSGMRFSDYSAYEITDVEDRFLRLKQAKTGERVTIPVMKKLRDILNRYDGNWPPPVSNQEFNRTIKEIFRSKALKIDKEITIQVDGVSKTVKLSSMVSSHTGRRTYATNMFIAGVPSLLIMSATGHKTEESFLKYIRATNEDKSRLLAEWMDKLDL
ncbi:site-specific integrase [Sphingobacterium deserti]|uniref:Integrase family protein n=1 Tax=Sphingobacterium deserti TaxID=1229276 RepID=A0A0B8T986_9SPHI|nr:site-specific integrase [Sphingobacterium deserti]KGE14565.1 integrase family protein [Sphingobacterium deserti]